MRATLLLISIMILSCVKETNVDNLSSQNLLIGIWEFSNANFDSEGVYNPNFSIETYIKNDELKDKYCIVFGEDYVFKSYDHGWCGTPPLSFSLTEGKYKQVDNLLTFDIEHYMFYDRKMEIIELTKEKLVVKVFY